MTANGARVVLLGASNLARGLPDAVEAARSGAPAHEHPPRLLVAAGRGRAYARPSSFLGRALSSIEACGLWRALEDSGGVQTVAVLADLGNDLAYGASEGEVLRAVDAVLERLLGRGARVTLASLPVASLDRFPAAWLETVRRVFFPTSDLPVPVILERAHRLDEALRRRCLELGVTRVEQPSEWYGLDPIHHRAAKRVEAWSTLTRPWLDEGSRDPAGGQASFEQRRRLAAAWPESSHLFGRAIRRRQPSATLPDGTTISLY